MASQTEKQLFPISLMESKLLTSSLVKLLLKTILREAVVGGADGTGLKIYETDAINDDYAHHDIVEHIENVTCVATNVRFLSFYSYSIRSKDLTHNSGLYI